MKVRILISTVLVAVVAFVAISASRNRPFAPASDLPRGALLYVQFEDLPSFIKLWNRSSFKAKYLESKNFQELSNHHLGLKLASRWQEFSDAAGFPLDLETVSGLAEKRAAVAIYDIGRLDFVFVAPMKSELFQATRLMQSPDKFEDQELDDGTHVYRAEVDADRGRQKQELLFANVKGRLIIATSEKFLSRTMSIIAGKSRKDSLADEPAFAALKDRTTPHTFSVWADQKALNDDYYFKHYWLIQNGDELKNLRAGLFNLSISDGEITEEREFLLNDSVSQNLVPAPDANELLSRIPEGTAFYRIQSANPRTVRDSLQNVLSTANDMTPAPKSQANYSHRGARPYDYEDDYDLGENYDENINDSDQIDEDSFSSANSKEIDFYSVLRVSGARSVLTLAKIKQNEAPLFVDFDRAAVFTLGSPAGFDRSGFESAVSHDLARHLLIEGQNLDARWTSESENRFSWREFDAPELGWSVEYAIVGNILIVANEPSFLSEIFQRPVKPENKLLVPINEYAVIRVPAARQGFNEVFDPLSQDKGDFFVGNIASFLDSASNVDQIEVRTTYVGKILKKEVRMAFH